MMRRYEPKPWDIRRCDMVRAKDGEFVRYDDASAEINRLTFALAEVEALELQHGAVIARLIEENRRLREALRGMVGLYDSDEGTRSLPEVSAARAALSSTGEKG